MIALPHLKMLPPPRKVSTASLQITNEEAAARENTAHTLIMAIINEAEALLASDGPNAYAQALTQGWEYLEVLEERQPEDLEEDEEWLIPEFEKANGSSSERLLESSRQHQQTIIDAWDILRSPSHHAQDTAHGIAAALLGTAAALREHIRGIAAKDRMSPGHALAAVGMKLTIDHLIMELEDQHEISCHHCDTIDRATDGAHTAVTALMAMRPSIRDMIPVNLHPSIHRDPDGISQAQDLARQTLDHIGNRGIFIQGDPASAHESMHAFYVQGVLHIKRLSDPYPKGTMQQEADTINATVMNMARHHADDHAEGFGTPLLQRLSEMQDAAENDLHSATDEEFDAFLVALHQHTSHPGTIAAAVTALTGSKRLARAHLARRKQLGPTASPHQVSILMSAAEQAGLHPELHTFLKDVLTDGAAGVLQQQQKQDPSTDEIITLLETAEELTTSTRRLRQIADTLGANPREDEELDDWLTSLEDEENEED